MHPWIQQAAKDQAQRVAELVPQIAAPNVSSPSAPPGNVGASVGSPTTPANALRASPLEHGASSRSPGSSRSPTPPPKVASPSLSASAENIAKQLQRANSSPKPSPRDSHLQQLLQLHQQLQESPESERLELVKNANLGLNNNNSNNRDSNQSLDEGGSDTEGSSIVDEMR